MTNPAVVSAFYERRRRLAYGFAVASLLLLAIQSYLGFTGETYVGPRAVPLPDGLCISHQVIVPGEDSGPGTRVLFVDPALGIRAQHRFPGDTGGLIIQGEEFTTFSGKEATVHRGGNSVGNLDLGQTWDVKDAVLDPARGETWIFGWSDGYIVARRRIGDAWSPAINVRKSGKIDGMTAAFDGGKGPYLAWSETGTPRVKTVFFDGQSFAPRAEFDLGSAELWEVVPVRGRLLAILHRREDRTFRYVSLRLLCCKDCGQPPPPERITFADPALVFGRVVTGLTATVFGEDLLILLTRGSLILARESSLQAGRAPLGTLLPPPGSRLTTVGSEPLWKRLGGNILPLTMLFCAVSLVSLGLVMLRERSRAALAQIRPPSPGPPIAEVLPRLLAHVLDTLILSPVVIVVADLLNWLPDIRGADSVDPNLGPFVGLTAAFLAAYYVPLEALLGWTPGKRILGLRVAGLDGDRPSALGVVLRTLLRLIDTNPLIPVGLIVMFMNPRRQRVGDLVGRTLVIQDRTSAEQSVRKGDLETGGEKENKD